MTYKKLHNREVNNVCLKWFKFKINNYFPKKIYSNFSEKLIIIISLIQISLSFVIKYILVRKKFTPHKLNIDFLLLSLKKSFSSFVFYI